MEIKTIQQKILNLIEKIDKKFERKSDINFFFVDLIEEIGYWHFAHSYVRGNWRKEEESSPIILAKSCHDLDIISWLAESTPKSVFSKGSLDIFKLENAPKTSTERCINCPVKDCLYDARKFYLNHLLFT